MRCFFFFFFFKQKTAYELRISDWSSDVCSSDLCSSAPAGSTVQGVPRVTAAAFAVQAPAGARFHGVAGRRLEVQPGVVGKPRRQRVQHRGPQVVAERRRSEEHTSELQSLMRISYAAFCLKKRKSTRIQPT